MSNRGIFAIMGIVAAAALVGLFFLVRGDDAPAEPARGSAAGSSAPRTGFAGPQHGPAGGRPIAPTLDPKEVPPNREYSSNGVIVHDHRPGTNEPYNANAAPSPGNTNKRLDSELTK